MVSVKRVDMEKFSITASELARKVLFDKIPHLAMRYALKEVTSDPSCAQKREQLEKACISTVETALFYYIKRHNIVTKTRQAYSPALGLFRQRETEICYQDVPSYLLDVKALVPDFPRMVSEVVLEARKRGLLEEIEAVTREAQGSIENK